MRWTPALSLATTFIGGSANPLSSVNPDAASRVEDVISSQHVLNGATSEREHFAGSFQGESQAKYEPQSTFTKDDILCEC